MRNIGDMGDVGHKHVCHHYTFRKTNVSNRARLQTSVLEIVKVIGSKQWHS